MAEGAGKETTEADHGEPDEEDEVEAAGERGVFEARQVQLAGLALVSASLRAVCHPSAAWPSHLVEQKR